MQGPGKLLNEVLPAWYPGKWGVSVGVSMGAIMREGNELATVGYSEMK